MGIRQEIEGDYTAALAALSWQLDMGADEAICDTPINAYDLPDKAPWAARTQAAPNTAAAAPKPKDAAPFSASSAGKIAPINQSLDLAIAKAQRLADACENLQDLDLAAAQFEDCPLSKLARKAQGGLGPSAAAVLVICDPPELGQEKLGRVFAQLENTLFEAIFSAIGLGLHDDTPDKALHLAPAMPWPLRGTSEDQAHAMAMMRPFVLRRMALIKPKAVVIMGAGALAMMLHGTSMTRARGQWHDLEGGFRALPMAAPSALLQNPAAKRDAWADALMLKSALRSAG